MNPYQAEGKLERERVTHVRAAAPSKYINNNIRGGSGIQYNYSPVRLATKIASTKITLATQREGQNRSGLYT